MDVTIPDLFNNLLDIFYSGLNDWGSIHPVVIHLPIVLLAVSPLFVISGLIFRKLKTSLFVSAFVLMALGTASIFLATSTGDAAAELLAPDPTILPALDAHVHLAERSRLIFTVLTCLFFVYIILISKSKKLANHKFNTALGCIFLILYSFALLLLFNAAHYGGKLVHSHGIKSSLYAQ